MAQKAFVATDEQRGQVEMFTAVGVRQSEIATLLEVSVDTLDRHFRRELDVGAAKANAKVAGKLYNKAMDGDTASIIFWLKTRAKWKETSSHEHSGPEGGPIQTINLAGLNDEQLRALASIKLPA